MSGRDTAAASMSVPSPDNFSQTIVRGKLLGNPEALDGTGQEPLTSTTMDRDPP
jgi:hypothetical protein